MLAGLKNQIMEVAGVTSLTRTPPPHAPAKALSPKDFGMDFDDDFEIPAKPTGKARTISPNAGLAAKLFYEEPQEYRIINVGFSTYGDYLCKYPESIDLALHIFCSVLKQPRLSLSQGKVQRWSWPCRAHDNHHGSLSGRHIAVSNYLPGKQIECQIGAPRFTNTH
jgi:hypothetical protein